MQKNLSERNISLKTINKYLIKYDIPHRRNVNIIFVKINRDKNGRFAFGIFLKPGTKVLSCCNDDESTASNKEEKFKGSRTRKVCNHSNNNVVVKTDEQEEHESNNKFDYVSFINDLEGFN